MNVFHFSKASPDFSLYDISPCFEANQQMHLMVRMGWHPDMDIENTRKLFNDEIRNAVTMWGKVTYIRVVNIEVTELVHSLNYYIEYFIPTCYSVRH